MTLALYQHSRNFAPVNIQNVLGESYAASNPGYGDQFNNPLYYYDNVDPNAPASSPPPSAQVSSAAGYAAPVPSILDHGGGSNRRALQGGVAGASGNPFESVFGGSASTGGGLLGGHDVPSQSSLGKSLGFQGFGSFTGAPQEQAQAWDALQKGVGGIGGLLASGMSPVGFGVGQYARTKANDAYPDQPAIGFIDDITHPDIAYGSPEDIQRALSGSLSKLSRGEALSADDKKNIASAYNRKTGRGVTAQDVGDFGEVSGMSGVGSIGGTPQAGLMGSIQGGLTPSARAGLASEMVAMGGLGVSGKAQNGQFGSVLDGIQSWGAQQRTDTQRGARTAEVQAARAAAEAAARAEAQRVSVGSLRGGGGGGTGRSFSEAGEAFGTTNSRGGFGGHGWA